MGKCRAKIYEDNEVVKERTILCYGNATEPRCEYLEKCIEENKDKFPKKRRGVEQK